MISKKMGGARKRQQFSEAADIGGAQPPSKRASGRGRGRGRVRGSGGSTDGVGGLLAGVTGSTTGKKRDAKSNATGSSPRSRRGRANAKKAAAAK